MTESACAAKTKVFLCGTNSFGQLLPNPEGQCSGELFRLHDHASSVLATCTFQTLYMDDDGNDCVSGESSSLLKDAVGLLSGANELVFVGQDMICAVIDAVGARCVFVRYEEERVVLVEECGWKTAAADGRGRIMSVDRKGRAYLFDSAAMFEAASGEGDDQEEMRSNNRFSAQRYGQDESQGQGSSDPVELPKFEKVSAGNAHFVLLAVSSESSRQRGSSVWVFGDARFGAVPLHPFEHTTVVGKLPDSDDPTARRADPTDVPYLMPVPHFATDQGFPSRIADVSAGSRHTLVLTADGDLYGWGWNESAALLPFTSDQASWEHNVIAEPTLLPIIDPADATAEVEITKIVGGTERSFAITSTGRLAIAGSNEFNTLALTRDGFRTVEKKPRFEREYSQIKTEYDCVNGFQLHPWLGLPDAEGSRPSSPWHGCAVFDIHASAFSTLITLQDKS